MKLFISISGSKFRDPSICDVAYKDPIKVRSVHFIGAKDWLRLPFEDLATAFDNPLIIRHPQGHTIPRLVKADEAQMENGEVKAEEHKGKVEEACKTQKPEGVIEKKMENGAGG
ncbi:hypothetical protein CK203_001003 [Vitis vinifera]|uniref:Serine hydrolase domain-containing protein n=1 Tax=Vitis vinifera TaxID=29760 RepID=A0A438KLP3_VITVI|nr:hypothetical protein CK203_001003 [Vitis vinifera]